MIFFKRVPTLLVFIMLLTNAQPNLGASNRWPADKIIAVTIIGGAAAFAFSLIVYGNFFRLSNREAFEHCMNTANEIKQSVSRSQQRYTTLFSLPDDALKQCIQENDKVWCPFLKYEEKLSVVIKSLRKNIVKLHQEIKTIIKRKIDLDMGKDKEYQNLFNDYTQAVAFVHTLTVHIHAVIDCFIKHRNRIISFPEYWDDRYRYKVAIRCDALVR